MQKKINLLLRDEFSLLVGVRGVVRLVVRTVRGRADFNEVRIEDARFDLWDDLTEADTVAGHVVAYQVKAQTTPLKEEAFRGQLAALLAQPAITVGCFSCADLVEVEGCGSLRVLRTLCKRLANKDIDASALVGDLTRDQRSWLGHIERLLGSKTKVALDLLSRLRIERLGDADNLRDELLDSLAEVSDDPEGLLDRLRNHLRDNLDAAARITWKSIRETVEAHLSVAPKDVNVVRPERARSWIDQVIEPLSGHLSNAIPHIESGIWTWRTTGVFEALTPLEDLAHSAEVLDDFLENFPKVGELLLAWRKQLTGLSNAARREADWLTSSGSSLPTIVSNLTHQFMQRIPSPSGPPWEGSSRDFFVHVIAQHFVNNVGELDRWTHASWDFWNTYRAPLREAVERFDEWKEHHEATWEEGRALGTLAEEIRGELKNTRRSIVREHGVAAQAPPPESFPEKF